MSSSIFVTSFLFLRRNRNLLVCSAIATFLTVTPKIARGQITLKAAVQLAIENSPQIKIAAADLTKARAALSETKAVFVPAISVSSGLGASSGITLTVPTIFTVNAQSLVFNYSQQDYIRASRFGVEAASHTLADARLQAEEDAAITYISLDNAFQRQVVLSEQLAAGNRLVSIVQERLAVGYDTELELMKAQKEAASLELQQVQLSHRIATLSHHLANVTGIDEHAVDLEKNGISPEMFSVESLEKTCVPSSSVLAAQADAKAKWQTGVGDQRYTWRPQVTLQAQYGRISPFNDVSSYYNLHGNYNTLAVGIQFQLPVLDQGRRARARESAAEAVKAKQQALLAEEQQKERCSDLGRSLVEAAAQYKIAQLDYKIASAQLAEILIRVSQASPGSGPMTPKEEQRALLDAGQKHLDALNLSNEYLETYIRYLKQVGKLEDWITGTSTP
ncbi:TolC family protein [Terriglobus albidus]|uniref:TolC family protein n=1 Tax=Terriglobus albidus TaxID=1592106 RepID=UPI0021E01220|nr:TolC family protein [Terriglobus albidus]